MTVDRRSFWEKKSTSSRRGQRRGAKKGKVFPGGQRAQFRKTSSVPKTGDGGGVADYWKNGAMSPESVRATNGEGEPRGR